MGWFNHQLENWRKIRLRISFRADVNMRAEPKGPMFWECFRARVHRTQKKPNGVDGKTGGRQLKVLGKHQEKSNLDILTKTFLSWYMICWLYMCQNAFTKAGRQPGLCSSINMYTMIYSNAWSPFPILNLLGKDLSGAYSKWRALGGFR